MNWNDKADYLTRLTYVSRASAGTGQEQLDDILEQSTKNNARDGIFGMLCLYQQYFMQTIEGPRNKINELHKRLLADERHHDLEVVEFSEIDHLTWNRWAMDIASSSSTSHMILKHYLKPIGHNAYLLTCAQAQDLLRALGHQTRAEHDEEA